VVGYHYNLFYSYVDSISMNVTKKWYRQIQTAGSRCSCAPMMRQQPKWWQQSLTAKL
jgi:hypothetical protein